MRYSYSRYVLCGTGSLSRIFDRVTGRSLDRAFTTPFEAKKEIERLHDEDRRKLLDAITDVKSPVAIEMLNAAGVKRSKRNQPICPVCAESPNSLIDRNDLCEEHKERLEKMA
jgi:tRNA(Ile2) C34 agmatinyltransferase TiaS